VRGAGVGPIAGAGDSTRRPRLDGFASQPCCVAVVRVEQRGRFVVHVYVEGHEPHKAPHCQIRWPDGEAAIELPSLRVIAGEPVPHQARQILEDHLEDIKRAWTRLNPQRPIT
jgi:hypothetical protein